MKQIFLFIALLSIPLTHFGQSESYRLDSTASFQKTANIWQKVAVNQYHYDSLGRFSKELLKIVGESDILEDYFSIEFSYQNDLITSAVYSGFSEDMVKFQPLIKVEANYNGNELIQQEIHHSWDLGLDVWVKDKKIEYIYQDEKLILKTVYSFPNCKDHNEWLAYEKHEFEYDHDQLLSHIRFDWQEEAWEGIWKEIYSYDENGNEVEIITYDGFASDDWIEYMKREKAFNDLGYFIEQINYRYNDLNEWEREYKYYYDRDEFGNLITYTQYRWTQEAWFEGAILDYTLNANIPSDDLILPLFTDPFGVFSKENGVFLEFNFKDDFYHMLDKQELYIWNYGQEQFVNTSYRPFYFSQHINGSDLVSQQEVIIYPNPADRAVYFNLKNHNSMVQLKVFDINGRLLINQDITDQSINVSGLNEGMYFYELADKKNTIKGKFMVQH